MITLEEVRVSDFRNLSAVALEFGSGLNIISGRNGSGKTSLLEAINVLASGKSFTGASASDFIARGSLVSTISGVVSNEGRTLAVGIEKTSGSTVCRAGGENVRSASVLAELLPVVSLDAQLFQFVGNTPAYRRSLLDRTLFHVEPRYLAVFKACHRALQQRNDGLRAGVSRSELEFWNQEFASYGHQLHLYRERCVTEMNEWLASQPMRVDCETLALEYRSGWRAGTTLLEALADSAGREAQLRTTLVGPHRAELRVITGGAPVKQAISRGQSKVVACVLVEAQLACLGSRNRPLPILLIDDICAELDYQARAEVLEMLLKPGRQAFVSVIDSKWLPEGNYSAGSALFHVERGAFSSNCQRPGI